MRARTWSISKFDSCIATCRCSFRSKRWCEFWTWRRQWLRGLLALFILLFQSSCKGQFELFTLRDGSKWHSTNPILLFQSVISRISCTFSLISCPKKQHRTLLCQSFGKQTQELHSTNNTICNLVLQQQHKYWNQLQSPPSNQTLPKWCHWQFMRLECANFWGGVLCYQKT